LLTSEEITESILKRVERLKQIKAGLETENIEPTYQ
jgi:hypothetical protein